MNDFAKSMNGKRFFDSQLPRLIKSLERIADAFEELNKNKENKECDKDTRS